MSEASRSKNRGTRQSPVPLLNFLFLGIVIFLYIYPSYQQYLVVSDAKVHFEACRANIDELHKSIELYRRLHNGELPNQLILLVTGKKKYIEKIPTCDLSTYAKGSSYGTSEGYEFIQVTPMKPAVYTIRCHGLLHSDYPGVKKDEPYYSSLSGLHPTDFEIGKRIEMQALDK